MAITNLTGTTWYVPSGWKATAWYVSSSANGTITLESGEIRAFTVFKIGYGFQNTGSGNSVAYDHNGTTKEIKSANSFTIHFVDNPVIDLDRFISWLETNGELQASEPETPTETPTEDSVKSKIQSLITKANTTTGKSDNDLTRAVLSLAEGYGQGGSSNVAAVCGKWRFNETVEKTSIPSYPYLNITQNVNFTTTIEGTVYQCTGMWVCASNFSDPTVLQYQGGGVPSVYRGGMDTWLYDSARNVDFGAEPQIVDPDFKDWLLANATRISSGEDSPLPIEISSESAMNALLATAAVGSVYKYRGTSGTYENGALYIVEAVS